MCDDPNLTVSLQQVEAPDEMPGITPSPSASWNQLIFGVLAKYMYRKFYPFLIEWGLLWDVALH